MSLFMKRIETFVLLFSCLARAYTLLKLSMLYRFALCKLIKLGDKEIAFKPKLNFAVFSFCFV